MPPITTTSALATVHALLPQVIGLWRELRAAHPDAPTYTDAELLALLRGEAVAGRAATLAWLRAHGRDREP